MSADKWALGTVLRLPGDKVSQTRQLSRRDVVQERGDKASQTRQLSHRRVAQE